jgi:hypothetical protein
MSTTGNQQLRRLAKDGVNQRTSKHPASGPDLQRQDLPPWTRGRLAVKSDQPNLSESRSRYCYLEMCKGRAKSSHGRCAFDDEARTVSHNKPHLARPRQKTLVCDSGRYSDYLRMQLLTAVDSF